MAPDFQLLGEIDDGSVRGTLNGGGRLLRARTGDGSVELRVRGG